MRVTSRDTHGEPATPLVYVHVPKAAGTSLKDAIARIYAPRPMVFFLQGTGQLEAFRGLPAPTRARCAVVAGHEPFGLHEVFDGCGVEPKVITVLREPVARVSSLYGYIFREPAHPLHGVFVERRVSLAEVYEQHRAVAFDNHQVRYLAGRDAHGKPFGGLTRDDLEVAKRNLAEGCAAFGLQESFEDSMAVFARELGWPGVPVDHLNVSPPGGSGGASARPALNDADRTLIAERNALDVELHDFACRLFVERMRP